MNKNAIIAITPEGSNNTNSLREVTWQLKEFYLSASGKRSKTYRLQGAPKSATASEGVDDFNFAPEYESIDICYKIDDAGGKIKGGKLEIFSRFDSKPLWVLDLKKMGSDWFKHGFHKVKWDGRIFKEKLTTATISGTQIEHTVNAEAPDKTVNPDAFPHGYITLAGNPFKVRMTLEPKDAGDIGLVTTSWTYFHVLVKKLEIELGEEDMIPAATLDDPEHKQNKIVYAQIASNGGVPATGSQRRVLLTSNLFKTRNAEMNDNTAFDEYKSLWADGPKIPLLASVYLIDSAGKEIKLADEKKGAVALGNVKFLWDWEDPDELVAAQQNAPAPYNQKPEAFITAAIDYYKSGTDATRSADDHTYPKGDNCHVDRGGKRGPKAKSVFPAHVGYAEKPTLDKGIFPFKVEACNERKWAALSQGWSDGILKGKTGTIFSPSRMAGDNFIVNVYLAYDLKAKNSLVLDDKAEPLISAPEIKASTGTWQIWREIHISRYIRKAATIPAYIPANIGAIQAIYDDAYTHVADKMRADDNYTVADHATSRGVQANYNALAAAKLNSSGNPMFTNDIAISRTANHAAVDSGLESFDYTNFVTNLHRVLHAGAAAAAGDFGSVAPTLGTTANALANSLSVQVFPAPHNAAVNRLIATKGLLVTNGLTTRQNYSNWLDSQAFGVLSKMIEDGADFSAIAGSKLGSPAGAQDGVTIVHFNFSNTYLRDLVAAGTGGIGYINGAAIDVSDANRRSCAFIFTNAMLDTFCHEIGHHLFLPHARFSRGGAAPGGAQGDRHDDLDTNCMMSYNRPRHAFCGLCQLRLRGWDAPRLDKILANNKKV